MPRSKTGRIRKKIDSDLSNAVKDVLVNKTKVRAAAKQFGVSRTTLTRHLLTMKNSENNDFIYVARNDVKKVFSEQQEIELVEYISS